MKTIVAILAVAAFTACASAAPLTEVSNDGLHREFVPVYEHEKHEHEEYEHEGHNHEEHEVHAPHVEESNEHSFDEEHSDDYPIGDYDFHHDEEEPDHEAHGSIEEEHQAHTRRRRFTCDVFSFSSQWVTPNHSACALKCIGKGRKGGHCEGQMCKCRDGSWIH